MVAFYVMLAVAVVMSGIFIGAWSRERPLISIMLKSLATISVIALGLVTVSMYTLDTVTILLLVGLAFCMMGDLVLALLELCGSDKRENIIQSGEISFALAQIVFLIMLAFMDIVALYGLIAGAVIAGIIYLVKKPMKLDFGNILAPSLIYAGLLGSNVAASIILMFTSGFNVVNILLAVGFILFIISDLILSKIYFGGVQKPIVQKINYVAYYLAIIFIALSFVGI